VTYNANHNGLGEMAAFLSVFSKKMTVCPIPIAGFGYMLSFILNLLAEQLK